MACDTIQQSQVNFTLENTDTDLLTAALEAEGYTIMAEDSRAIYFQGYNEAGTFASGQFEKATGKVSARVRGETEDFDINSLKRAYSCQVIKHAGKRFGWSLKETSSNKGQLRKKQ